MADKPPKLGETAVGVGVTLCPVLVCALMAAKKADHRTIIYLSSSDRRELKRIAQREGRSVSSLLRQLALERIHAEKKGKS